MIIGIITHYDVHNPGAVLQLYALKHVFTSKDIKAYALRFEKNYDFIGTELKYKYVIGIGSLPVYLKYLFQKGIKQVLFNIKKKKLLDKFRKNNALIDGYYTEAGVLDAVCIGSDEVFALHTGPTPVLFGYALPTDYVFSFAGSFGPTNYEDIVSLHCLPFVKSGLEGMRKISVRDNNSLKIVEQVTGKIPDLVCDPVLLYRFEKEICGFCRLNLPKFLLVYAYDNNMNDQLDVDKIKEYAKSKNLKIISPGFYHKWCDINVNVDPLQLINYFRNSESVVTDTFHGCVLSIVTNREMAVKTRENCNKICNLLIEYGLENRTITNARGLSEIFSKNVDFKSVNEEIEKRRSASMEFLKSCIDEIQESSL